MKSFILPVLMVMFIQPTFCQTEIFDIITYTPPKDFKKESKQSVVTYTHINDSSFCIISMYASKKSAGDEQKDFKNEWKELVVSPFKGNANPETETQSTADGWKAVVGASLVKLDDVDVLIILTVFSGYGKTLSVMSSLSEHSYTTVIDSFLETMKLDKTSTPISSNNKPLNNQSNDGTTGQFGSMIYKTPAGWIEQKYQEGVTFKPLNIPADEFLLIQILPPLNFSGSIEQALDKSYDDAVIMHQVIKMNDINGGSYSIIMPARKSYKGWEYIRASGGVQIDNETKDEYGLDLFVMKINNRFERVAILQSRTFCGYSRYYPTYRLSYYNDTENFLYSLKFTDWKEPSFNNGTLKGEGLIGIWQGITMRVGVAKPGAILGAESKVTQLIFFSNGQAFFGTKFPMEGLYELNTWTEAETSRRDWGTYTFSNGRGVLKMPYGDIPLRMENKKLTITTNQTNHSFIKSNSIDGSRFNGTYAFPEYDGAIPSITFTTEGRFTDNGALRVLYHTGTDCINPALTFGSGTYEARDHTIVFNYTDGRKIKIAFPGTNYDKKNPSPATLILSFNGDELKRQ